MKLFISSEDDYCVAKVLATASAVNVQLEVEKTSNEVLKELAPSGTEKSFALQTSTGEILFKHIEILKFLASLCTTSNLIGSNSEDIEKVNYWLDLAWQQMEVPIQLLLALSSSDSKEFQMGIEEKSHVTIATKGDICTRLSIIENHLFSKTFFVGESITLADISLFAVCAMVSKLGVVNLSSFPSTYRWFMTTGYHTKLYPVLKDMMLPAAALSSGASASKPISKCTVGNNDSTTHADGKWQRYRVRVKELLSMGDAAIGTEVTVKGWIRTSRSAEKGTLFFVELTDGSTVKGVQLVMNLSSTEGFDSIANNSGGAGASLSAVGIVVASPAKGQTIEINVSNATLLGAVYGGDKGEIGGKNYPMAKKAHGLEYLREIAHLRPRSKFFSSAMRMRNAMAFATHKFFYERGFIYTHTPLITSADCEGAGEQFSVTTLLPESNKLTDIPVDKKGMIDFTQDFFGAHTCLSVSGQLNVETHAAALSDVYTFGPTFRAENSHTSRHLAEFWMIEPEICFAELSDDMALAEDYVQYCAKYALDNCADDIQYFEHEYPAGEKGLKSRLENVCSSDFARITYTEAIALLQKEIASGDAKFERYPSWGDDLGSEHERYLCEKIYKRPTIVINYPKGIKAFYMKLNDDNITVAAMDILVPKIGELIGGSQREDSLEILEKRCIESGLTPKDIWWYADLRRYGTVPHAGFGLGFERLIMFVTGLENIRDVIPFPRHPGHAEF